MENFPFSKHVDHERKKSKNNMDAMLTHPKIICNYIEKKKKTWD